MLVDVKLVGELGHGMELGVHPSAIELPCDLHWGCDMRHTEARAVVVSRELPAVFGSIFFAASSAFG
jgi:hypothetical protein